MAALAIRPLSGARAAERTGVAARLAARPVIVLAAALPLIFLKATYQRVAGIEVADVAVAAVGVTAIVMALRSGVSRLRDGVPIWIGSAALLAWIAVRTLTPGGAYETGTHAVTAAKFAEWAVLAPAVPLLVRRGRDLELVLGVLAACTLLADVVALVQFFGLDVFGRWRPGGRQPSFLGPNDYSVLATAALLAGTCWLAFGLTVRRLLGIALLAFGAVGAVLGGSSAGVLGCWLAFGGAILLARGRLPLRRRTLFAAASVLVVVTIGVANVRGRDYDQLLRFLGVKVENVSTRRDVQTYAQRTILAYIGGRIFLDHPVAGAGWQASNEPRVFMPYVPDAKRRFPHRSPLAFPSPSRVYGVQNGWIQSASDLGVIGFALFAALIASGIALAWQARSPLVAAWMLLLCALWLGEGLYAGVPLDGLTWLALGLRAVAND